MDDTTLKIAIAAFMHDIGKFSDREVLDITEQYIDNHAGLYLPFYQGRYSHYHALYTAGFIEKMGPFLPGECNRPGWGEGDSFINLAAGHHNPDTPMQWIIAVADRVSSGWDRDTYEESSKSHVHWKDYKKTRMLSLFEQLKMSSEGAGQGEDKFLYRYPLEPVSPKSIFPLLENVLRNRGGEPDAEYRSLFQQFVEDLKSLRHGNENPGLWFEHFDSLIMRYGSPIPAARAGDVIPDVSLYDHSRLTSALAAALYRFHCENQSLNREAVKDYEQAKFLMIGADFYGIQEFIFSGYGDTRRYRSKLLRGRSFAVSLLMELAADMACREMGLPHVSVVLNVGGKFTLLAHNTESAKQSLRIAEQKINDWLMRVTYGETGIGFSSVEASPSDFVSGRFERLWDRLGEAVAARKFSRVDLERHGGVVGGYLDGFLNTLHRSLCPICGKRPSSHLAENSLYVGDVGSSCTLCRDHIFLGANVVKKSRLAVTTKETVTEGRETGLLEPLFGEYQVSFPAGGLNELAASGKLLKHWDLIGAGTGVAIKYINGYVPVYGPEDQNDERILAGGKGDDRNLDPIDQFTPGEPKTLNHIAAKARNPSGTLGKFVGIEALGILKADVDYLGILMSCGLKPERFTLSRLATLSRELNWFFALYLPDLLRTDLRFHDVYTVFAGGDDLFLIGPWNRIMELALVLRERFSEYVCHNSDVHFSAGIALVKPMTPIDMMAERGAQALQASKKNRNSLTLFSQTVPWSEVESLVTIKDALERWLKAGWINQAMLHRMNGMIQMAGEERRVIKQREISLDDLACTRWRFLLAYTCGRNVAKDIKNDLGKSRQKAIEEVKGQMSMWLSQYGEKLTIPLWTILYNNR